MEKLLTTLEVRDIMRKHGRDDLYTNKTRKANSNLRRVKCYKYFADKQANDALYAELCERAGKHNIHETSGTNWIPHGAFTVKCVLA